MIDEAMAAVAKQFVDEDTGRIAPENAFHVCRHLARAFNLTPAAVLLRLPRDLMPTNEEECQFFANEKANVQQRCNKGGCAREECAACRESAEQFRDVDSAALLDALGRTVRLGFLDGDLLREKRRREVRGEWD
jgi:hypothetical protein